MKQVLSTEELRQFDERGWVRLKGAFDAETVGQAVEFIWRVLKGQCEIDRDDRSTWHNKTGQLSQKCRSNKELWRQADDRLHDAIAQLLGPDWQQPKDWGALLCTFPHAGDEPWTVPADFWHWDYGPFKILEGGKGLFVFSHFSPVGPQGGGTLIVEGSHELLLRYCRDLGENRPRKAKSLRNGFQRSDPWLRDLTRKWGTAQERVERFMEQATDIDGVAARVVELTGEPGDAVLCHPCIMHSRSPNKAAVPRMMRATAFP